ncbi:MAG TPA: GAF domain-containing protein [Thermoleophilia bacterium]|nr:GAF domain-containing protein [Thermoleophilia bacterium]
MSDPAAGRTQRHLQLLTDTVAAVSSSLDLSEVLTRIASTVAEAMATDACFVYLYDEAAGVLELRATHGTVFDDPAHRPRLHLGEGITGSAAAQLEPIVIAAEAHLDPRFHRFPNLHEDEYESILAVPVLSRDRLAGALNVRTRLPRDFRSDEVALLTAIAGQVGQAIENAKLYERSQRRVAELEALSDIARSITSALYLDEAVSQITETTTRALRADGCALVLLGDDGAAVAHRHGSCPLDAQLLELAAEAPTQHAHAAARPLLWKHTAIGAIVVCADRERRWAEEELSLLETIARQAAAAVETARTALRGLLAQEIHHRVKNNLQTVASLLRLQLRTAGGAAAEKALQESINRILSIAAVHDLLTAARQDDIDCADLIERLRPMLGHGMDGRTVTVELDRVTLPGDRATALALVFCELFSNAVEHGRGGIDVRLGAHADTIELVVGDEGDGPPPEGGDGLGLGIARSLVAEQLAGSLELAASGGGRAVVRFPAVS